MAKKKSPEYRPTPPNMCVALTSSTSRSWSMRKSIKLSRLPEALMLCEEKGGLPLVRSSIGSDRRFVETHHFAFGQHMAGHCLHHFVPAGARAKIERRIKTEHLKMIVMRAVVFWRMRSEVSDCAV